MLSDNGRYVRCSGASLGFTVADYADNDEIWLVHDSTERDTERIPEFTTLVDGSWSLSVDVTVRIYPR